jgi:hypothetical protein
VALLPFGTLELVLLVLSVSELPGHLIFSSSLDTFLFIPLVAHCSHLASSHNVRSDKLLSRVSGVVVLSFATLVVEVTVKNARMVMAIVTHLACHVFIELVV